MSQKSLKEAAGLLVALSAALQSSSPALSKNGPALLQACGALSSGAVVCLQQWQAGTPMLICFQAATAAGATAQSWALVRSIVMSWTPVSALAALVAQTALYMTLAEEVRSISQTVFKSRDDVELTIAAMNAAFSPALDYAAQSIDATAWRALTALRAAMARDLAVRAFPLPSMKNFAMAKPMSMLSLACLMYNDAARCDELTAENHVVHPLFGPLSGRALSS